MMDSCRLIELIHADRAHQALDEVGGAMETWQDLHNQALCLEMTQRYKEAQRLYGEAIQAAKDRPGAQAQSQIGIANCFRHMGDAGRNLACLEHALSLDADHPQAHFLLSAHRVLHNDLEEAVRQLFLGYDVAIRVGAEDVTSFTRAYAASEPWCPRIYRRGAATLLDMLYAGVDKPNHIFIMHKFATAEAHQTFAGTAEAHQTFAGTAQPRWAFVSEHLREGSVAQNFMPLLRALLALPDDVVPKPVCVWDVGTAQPNRVTEELKSLPRVLYSKQRPSPVDVAVCLDGHTGTGEALHRLAVRLAPVQVDYLGYPFTTGSPAFDLKIVDGTTDPAGQERWYTEELVRLPRCMWAWNGWDLPEAWPAVNANALLVCQNFSKVRPGFLGACQGILDAHPAAHIHFRCTLRDNSSAAATFQDWIRPHFTPDTRHRVVHARSPGAGELQQDLATYHAALDTWPYNGTVTTIECLAAGLPVVTFQQPHHRGRTTSSILTACNLTDYITHSAPAFRDRVLRLLREEQGKGCHLQVAEAFHNSEVKDAAGLAKAFAAGINGAVNRRADREEKTGSSISNGGRGFRSHVFCDGQ